MESNKKREEDPIVILRRKKKRRRIIREAAGRIFLLINIILFIILIVLVVKNNHYSKKMKKQLFSFDGKSSGVGSKESRNNKESKEKEEQLISKEKIEEFVKLYSEQSNLLGDNTSDSMTAKQFENFMVCIDAGHGGSDCGAMTNSGIEEKEQTLILAKKVRQYLESIGINIVMTRTEDVELSLEERREIANSSGADVLVSIHRNMYTGKEKIAGIEAWINNTEPYEARKIAEDILDNITDSIKGVNNRGVKTGSMDNPYENFAMNKVEMTSMIIEVGFMSSSYDNKWFEKYNDDIAEAIAKGIADNVILFYES